MSPKIIAPILVFLALIFLAVARSFAPNQTSTEEASGTCLDFSEASITISNQQFNISIASAMEEKIKGLSGCPHLPENTGLYFPYETPELANFWMKDMLIPIDIIWIVNGRIVGIEQNVPAPAPNTPDTQLPRYRPPVPIDAVLELPAGFAAKYKISTGQAVAL